MGHQMHHTNFGLAEEQDWYTRLRKDNSCCCTTIAWQVKAKLMKGREGQDARYKAINLLVDDKCM